MDIYFIKKIFQLIFGGLAGYFIGAMLGALTAALIWSVVAMVSGEFVFYSSGTFALNFLRSLVPVALLSSYARLADTRSFGGRTSYWVWFGTGMLAMVYVMSTYGFNVVFHPDDFGQYGYFLSEPKYPDPFLEKILLPRGKAVYLHFGAGTGLLIGSYQGAMIGLVIAFREVFRKRKTEDKKEFDQYSDFIQSRIEKK